jgi:broad specificity phosphatase PhoE
MKPPATRLYLVRHGEVEVTYHQIFGGRIDMELSPYGQTQAVSVAEHFEPHCFDGVYCSPMQRARQTVSPLLAAKELDAVTVDEFREVDFGDWTGHRWEEIQHKFGVNAFTWLEQIEQGAVPNAETGDALRQRIQPRLEEILARHDGGAVLVVCHGGVIRVILSLLLRLPLPAMAALEVDYASISVIDCRQGRAILQLLNHTPWRSVV